MDANADRAAEALRVVGDIARFVLDQQDFATQLREIRSQHWRILSQVPGLLSRGVQNRDSVGDVGREFAAQKHEDLYHLTRSNFHRAQESFRCLEESLRSLAPQLAPQMAQLRYRCYDLEPPMMVAMEQWSMQHKLDFGLYVVLGNEFSNGRDFLEVSEKAIAGGVGAIQLRDKYMADREILPWAYRLRELTRENNVTFIMNDRIEVALAVSADGVHLGQDDFPVAEARKICGPHFIIGASTHNVDEAKQAVQDGASYFNIGPIFQTGTKKGVISPVSPEMITKVTNEVQHPFTVMGGIKLHNVDEVLQRGARRIAVVTAVVGEEDITAAARAFTDKINQYKQLDQKNNDY